MAFAPAGPATCFAHATSYGIDASFRDPSGNNIRLTQVSPDLGG